MEETNISYKVEMYKGETWGSKLYEKDKAKYSLSRLLSSEKKLFKMSALNYENIGCNCLTSFLFVFLTVKKTDLLEINLTKQELIELIALSTGRKSLYA